MSIGAITPVTYVPVTPVAPVRASSRGPELRASEAESRAAPPSPPPASRPPPGQGRLVDIRA